MNIDNEIKLDFDDVLICPQRSTLKSRKDVVLEREFTFRHGQKWNGIPIIVSNMDSTGTIEMANVIGDHGGLVALHKYYAPGTIAKYFFDNKEMRDHAFITFGISDKDQTNLSELFSKLSVIDLIPKLICLDVANGYMEKFTNIVKQTRQQFPESIIMAGNVVTKNMVEELILSGADIVKVGLGSGAVCTTRTQTGVGYPQLSAIIKCSDAAHGLDGHICADGGIRTPGDAARCC